MPNREELENALSKEGKEQLLKIREALKQSSTLWNSWQTKAILAKPASTSSKIVNPTDIKRLPEEGYFVFLLPVQHLDSYYGPSYCLEVLQYFNKKLERQGVDVILLYGNPLEYLLTQPAKDSRNDINSKVIKHRLELVKMITDLTLYNLKCFFFMTWDYFCLSTDFFQDFQKKLEKAYAEDSVFKEAVDRGLNKQNINSDSVSVALDEIAMRHIIRQKLIEFPSTFVKNEKFRLIINLEKPLPAEVVQWQKKILPQPINSDSQEQAYFASHYDFSSKLNYHFDEMSLDFDN